MSLQESIKVIVGYNNRMLYEGLDCGIRSKTDDIEFVYGIRNSDKFVNLVADLKLNFNYIIIELELVDDPAISYIQMIRSRFREVPLLILGNLTLSGKLNRLIETGISGFVLKQCNLQDLIYGLRNIRGGSNFFCGAVTRMLMEEIKLKDSNVA